MAGSYPLGVKELFLRLTRAQMPRVRLAQVMVVAKVAEEAEVETVAPVTLGPRS